MCVRLSCRLHREALKQAAIDPSTGKIDISILTTGMSGAARKQRAERAQLLRALIKEKGKVVTLKYAKLFEEFRERVQEKLHETVRVSTVTVLTCLLSFPYLFISLVSLFIYFSRFPIYLFLSFPYFFFLSFPFPRFRIFCSFSRFPNFFFLVSIIFSFSCFLIYLFLSFPYFFFLSFPFFPSYSYILFFLSFPYFFSRFPIFSFSRFPFFPRFRIFCSFSRFPIFSLVSLFFLSFPHFFFLWFTHILFFLSFPYLFISLVSLIFSSYRFPIFFLFQF